MLYFIYKDINILVLYLIIIKIYMTIKEYKRKFKKQNGYNISDFEIIAKYNQGVLPLNDKLENEIIKLINK